MESLKKIISGFKEEDYFNRVNLHIHSSCSDGVLDSHAIIEQACQKNLEYISITDHNTIEAYNYVDFDKLNGLNLIPGVEFDCWHRTDFMHILGYGFDLDDENIRKLCAKSKQETRLDIVRIFSPRKAPEVINSIKKAGGLAILAHPACCWSLNLEKMIEELISFGLDGLELYYPYVRHRRIFKFHSVKKIKKIIKKNKLFVTGGTDCHGANLTINK